MTIPPIPLRMSTALLAVIAMIVVAIGTGTAIGVVTRPVPTEPPASPTPLPTVTPEPDTEPLVFKQPLAAGCATDDAVFVVSNGGGVGRFDGQKWQLIDSTLRSLVSAGCGSDLMQAVGPFGRLLTIDDQAKTIQADDLGLFDAYAISILPDGALVVGSEGSVQRETSAGWQPYAKGIEEDLFGVVGFASGAAWAVGSQGVTYRLEPAGWRPFETGTKATLRTIAASSPTDALTAGDGGVLLRFDGHWLPLDSGVTRDLRSSVRLGAITYVVGDGGTALAVEGVAVRSINLNTTCAIRDVFTKRDEVWFVGSEGTHAGVWRMRGEQIVRWGTC